MTFVREALGAGAEFDLIREMLSRVRPDGTAGGAKVELGPGDDCAVFSGGRIAVTTDLCVEGVHYRPEWVSPSEVGFRATVAALSDLAAMSARPIGVLLSLAIESDRARSWGPEIAVGVGEAIERYGAVLLGGDLSRAAAGSAVVMDVTALGELSEPVLRSGSQPGDHLWVTGTLGGAAAAVAHWMEREGPPPQALRDKFARPNARIEESDWLRQHAAVHAMIDLSDGIASDAGHLASAGGVRVALEGSLLPVDPGVLDAFGSERGRELALTGGEDYELAFTAPHGAVESLTEAFEGRFGLPLTRVGVVTSGTGLHILGAGPGTLSGFDHFGGRG